MPWNYQTSTDRVRTYLDNLGEIEIEDLDREMDLDNLTPTKCRKIYGAHVYGEIRNLATAVNDSTVDRKNLIQAVHVYQREVARIAAAVGGVLIAFQGGRAHVLIYRPIRDAGKIAAKAIDLQLILDRFGIVFNEEFTNLTDLRIQSGADIGDAIGTRNGMDGDREKLFLGRPANHAAKLLGTAVNMRLTDEMMGAIPADKEGLASENLDGAWKLRRVTVDELAEILEGDGIDWSPEDARKRIRDDKTAFPAADVGLSAAKQLIKFDDLSFYNSKEIAGATVYGDVSGFTAYIDAADTTEKLRAALREFHAIRHEMARVVRTDYDGIRIQFQGDRVQGLFHTPVDSADGFCTEAVNAAIGLQSSFELVLKEQLPNIASLGIAVGVSQGETIATKLGERGHRDRICLGSDVLRAEQNEERVGKQDVGISANVRDHLENDLAERFVWNTEANCYVAHGLDHNKLSLSKASSLYEGAAPVFIRSGTTVTGQAEGARKVTPSTTYRG
jgi:Adenylate and Guanylate cyclase catalytic domain